MANAVIANASIAVTPTFPGLSAAINKAFGANGVTRATTATGAKAGSDFSSSFGGSIMKSGAIAGAVSAVAGKAISAVTASMGSAIARFDTLNNYPKVMQTLDRCNIYDVLDREHFSASVDTALFGEN